MDMRTLKILVSDGDCVLHGEWLDVCEMIFSFPECGTEEEFREFLRGKGFVVEDTFWDTNEDRESETSRAVRDSANRELDNPTVITQEVADAFFEEGGEISGSYTL